MRVGLVQSTPFPPQEGIGVYTAGLAAELRRLGHEAVLFTRGGRHAVSAEESPGLGMVRRPSFFPLYPFHLDLHRRPMERALRQEGLDLVHFHSPLPPAAKAGLPVVTTFHSPMRLAVRRRSWREAGTLAARLQAPFSYATEKRLLALSDAVTTVSQSRAKELATYGIPVEAIDVVPSGVDVRRFAPSPRPDGPPRILYVGRLAPAKGLRDLLAAMPAVLERHPAVVLQVVGGGPLAPALRRQAAALGIQAHVEFTGVVAHADLPRHYAAADVVVLPSLYEGLPTCVLEAMACGRAVVGCDAPGTRDVVVPGRTGLLVPVHDPPGLATALADLLGDASLRTAMGREGRRLAERDYDWRALVGRFLGIYRRVLEAP